MHFSNSGANAPHLTQVQGGSSHSHRNPQQKVGMDTTEGNSQTATQRDWLQEAAPPLTLFC